MVKNILISALSICAAAGICLCVASGGCVKTAPGGKQAASDSEQSGQTASVAVAKRAPVRIGADASTIGQVEYPALVQATVYSAAGSVESGRQAELQPGTWLVPESAYGPLAGPIARPNSPGTAGASHGE